MADCWGVLLETVSIQRYIFQSNKLKTNLGASYLIQHRVFGDLLEASVSTVFSNKTFDFTAWEKKPSEILIEKEPFEVGYIGGGNALLFFREKPDAEAFIRAWTRLLLIQAPGIKTAVAAAPFDPNGFKDRKKALFRVLQENKGRHVPQTTLPRHGITAECRQSGLSAEIWSYDIEEYLSSVTYAKTDAAKGARDHFQKVFAAQLKDQFCFTDQFEKLGSISGDESRIAVVHIDGNRMAKRFMNAGSLQEMRKLSGSVRAATLEAFSDLLEHVVEKYPDLMKDLGFDSQKKEKPIEPWDDDYQKKILPITPIVIGGDDVTFVCDGRLGIHFARVFIEAFEKKGVSDRKKLTACAGIAVIKVKYPFYRGYQLAEELCDSAKKENGSKEEADSLESFLDFQISTGSIFGSLDQIHQQYRAPRGKLLFRPYKLVPKTSGHEKSLGAMLEMAADLKKLPNTRINELGQVLTQSEDRGNLFLEQLAFRNRSLPRMENRFFHKNLFDNQETIYFDMIELSGYYPRSQMRSKGGER